MISDYISLSESYWTTSRHRLTLLKVFLMHLNRFIIWTGIWSECNRSELSLNGIRKSDSPPQPVWTPKSAPQSPTVERRFRPVQFESPTLQRKNLPSNGTTPPPWTQPNYPDKPYQPSIIKSSSWNAISRPKTQIIYRKARGSWDCRLTFSIRANRLVNHYSCWSN